MRWSKTKKSLERFLNDNVKQHVQIHATVYRKFHDAPARIWITFDGQEILSASSVTFAYLHEQLYATLKQSLKPIPYNDDIRQMLQSEERQKLVDASDLAEQQLMEQGIFDSYYVYSAFMSYHTLSIDDALMSEDLITQAFAMLDRRLGTRRLRAIYATKQHPIVAKFHHVRCTAEKINMS